MKAWNTFVGYRGTNESKHGHVQNIIGMLYFLIQFKQGILNKLFYPYTGNSCEKYYKRLTVQKILPHNLYFWHTV